MARTRPLTNKERQKAFRERRKESSRYEEYLAEERQRWQKRKEAGKLKGVNELTKKGQRQKRREWRKSQRRHREQQRALENVLVTPDEDSGSEEPPHQIEDPTPNEYSTPNKDLITQKDSLPSLDQGPSTSSQKKLGRKRVKNQKTKAYRRIKELEIELLKERQKCDKYRQRYYRSRNGSSKDKGTPRSKARSLLKHGSNKSVCQSLVFGNVLATTLAEKYRISSETNKFLLKRLCWSKFMTKYKMKKMLRESTGISLGKVECSLNRRLQKSNVAGNLKKGIAAFMTRDDNSRITTGKSDTVTRKKIKKQRRVMLDSLQNLHTKYKAEKNSSISYSLFCKLRPFEVCQPKARDRQTRLCQTCENSELMLVKLKQHKILPATSTLSVAAIEPLTIRENLAETETWWYKWTYKVDEVLVDEKMKKVRRLQKEKQVGTVSKLSADFESLMANKARDHLDRIKHQFGKYQESKSTQNVSTGVIIIDFSENYACGYGREPQSMHFGGSKKQATLRPGVLYINNTVLSFATISPSYKHDPAAIWAYLKPVFQHISAAHPEITMLNIWSDGPTTQYRNKENFFLFQKLLGKYCPSVKTSSWNLFEAGHGKGAADAVGGTLKRMADDALKKGTDIPSAEKLFEYLETKSKIKLFFVEEREINEVREQIPEGLKAIQGTMKLHQILFRSGDVLKITVRDLSCFETECQCYNTRSVALLPETVPEQNSDGENLDDGNIPQGNIDQTSVATEELHRENIALALTIGQWCIVRYDGILYPGEVIDSDEVSLQVKVLHPIGNNKFVEPRNPDVLWYHHDAVVKLVPKPQPPSKRSRFVSFDSAVWNEL